MLRSALYRFGATVMAFVVLLSTVSFTIEKHYCGDHLVDMALFTGAEDCTGQKIVEAEAQLTPKKHCCKNEVDFVEGQNELKLSSVHDLDMEQQVFLVAWFLSSQECFKHLQQHVIPHKDYSPPRLIEDRQIRDQVFLI